MDEAGRADADELAAQIAEIAASYYGALLSQEIPGHPQVFFTSAQAFELTRVVIYEALKDADLV